MQCDLRGFTEVRIKKTRYLVSPPQEGGARVVLHEVNSRDGRKRLVRVIGNPEEVIAALPPRLSDCVDSQGRAGE